MAFNFKKQLEIGKDNEALFKAKFPELEKLDGKGPDFKLDGVFIELKSDTYDYNQTGNFFMERFSSVENQSPGGPWQAQLKGSSVFCYNFIKHGALFVFSTDELIDHLNANEGSYRKINVKNRGWTTVGYLVPIDTLVKLFKKYDLNQEVGVEIFKL